MEKLREAGLMEEKETHGFEVVGTDKLRGQPRPEHALGRLPLAQPCHAWHCTA